MNNLLEEGFVANTIWQGCFSEDETSYIVYLGLILNSFEEAEIEMRALNRLLRQKGLESDLEIHRLDPYDKNNS